MSALEYTAGGIAAEVSVFLVLISSAVVLRFIARRKQKIHFGVDDYLVIPAWLCFVAIFSLAIYGISQKFIGYPADMKSPGIKQQITEFAQVYWSAAWISVIGLGCVRLSALFFYRRIFTSSKRWDLFRTTTLFMIVVVTLWMLGFVLLAILACGSDVEDIWDPKTDVSCQNYNFLIGVAISSFILDVIVILLPIPKVWHLHTTTPRKFAISAVFLLAAAGIGASCARMVRYTGEYRDGREANQKNIFINNTALYFYQTLELGLCSVAVNLPSLWYFFAGVTPESLVQALRSMVSLRSLGSSRASSTKRSTEPKSPASHSTPAFSREDTEDTRQASIPSTKVSKNLGMAKRSHDGHETEHV